VIWRVPGEGHGRPATDGSLVYFLSKHHEVIAVDARTGDLRWRESTGEPDASTLGSAVVIAGASVVAGDYNLVAFDRTTGAVRWRFVPVIGHAPGIYLGEATNGLVLAGSPAGRAYAVSAATGSLVWDAAIDSRGLTTVFQPVTDGSIVVAGYTTFTAPNRGGIVALDLRTGRELWRTVFSLTSDPLLGAAPVSRDPRMGHRQRRRVLPLRSLRSQSGEVRWSIPPVRTCPRSCRARFRDRRPRHTPTIAR
jgi:outer membrane protein assembly factor BamB